jgi:hypothetical protein
MAIFGRQRRQRGLAEVTELEAQRFAGILTPGVASDGDSVAARMESFARLVVGTAWSMTS